MSPNSRSPQTRHECSNCGALKTPLWRTGPIGAKTLCNACGVRWGKGKLMLDGTGKATEDARKAFPPPSPLRTAMASVKTPVITARSAPPPAVAAGKRERKPTARYSDDTGKGRGHGRSARRQPAYDGDDEKESDSDVVATVETVLTFDNGLPLLDVPYQHSVPYCPALYELDQGVKVTDIPKDVVTIPVSELESRTEDDAAAPDAAADPPAIADEAGEADVPADDDDNAPGSEDGDSGESSENGSGAEDGEKLPTRRITRRAAAQKNMEKFEEVERVAETLRKQIPGTYVYHELYRFRDEVYNILVHGRRMEVLLQDTLDSLGNSKTKRVRDVSFAGGEHDDGPSLNGAAICGVMNSRGKPCQRQGVCPFHGTIVDDKDDNDDGMDSFVLTPATGTSSSRKRGSGSASNKQPSYGKGERKVPLSMGSLRDANDADVQGNDGGAVASGVDGRDGTQEPLPAASEAPSEESDDFEGDMLRGMSAQEYLKFFDATSASTWNRAKENVSTLLLAVRQVEVESSWVDSTYCGRQPHPAPIVHLKKHKRRKLRR